jgi:hypothetical protein
MLKVENDDKNLDVLSILVRCKNCGNTWTIQIGNGGIAPQSVTRCYRCLAKEAEERERKQGVSDER